MHTGGEGRGIKQPPQPPPPRQIFEKLVNKNAIKPRIGGLPWQFLLKALTPLTPDFKPVIVTILFIVEL
jgi:hypothetical protein